jgi:3-phytase
VPPTQFAVSGLVELLPFNDEFMLSMERSFSVGAPGTGNTIKLYSVAFPGADDVNGFDSIAGLLGTLRPARKTLLLDLRTLGIPLDNVEGMTIGPNLPDGRRSLVLVSDNNFAASQFTQFLLFALD